jgi:hypothetical protein
MSIPGSVNPLFLGAAGQATGGGEYQIERSVRFNSPDSAYLSRTPASSGNRKTWTWAGWVKRSGLSSRSTLFGAGTSINDWSNFAFESDDAIQMVRVGPGGGSTIYRKSTAVFRDSSAWYHIVLAWDTTQATANDRVKIYINGLQITAFSSVSNPSQNYDEAFFNTTTAHAIGRSEGNSDNYAYFSGYLADIHFIDGQALDPSSFGEFDTNGVWQPIDASGLTYGTNGFRLPFSDNSTAAALGTDTSSNGNTWTVNNFAVGGTGSYLSGFSGDAAWSGAPRKNAFDGSISTYWQVDQPSANTLYSSTWTAASSIPFTTLRVYAYPEYGYGQGGYWKINGVTMPNQIGGAGWYTPTGIGSSLSTIELTAKNNGSTYEWCRLYAIEIDGVILIDSSIVGPGNDSLVDTPTNGSQVDTGVGGEVVGNYCTLNPLVNPGGSTLSNGNLDCVTTYGNSGRVVGSIAVSSGKWYWEVVKTGGSAGQLVGIAPASDFTLDEPGKTSNSFAYYTDGGKYSNSTLSSYGSSWTTGDVIGVALDLDTGTIVFYKNNTSQGTAFSGLSGNFVAAISDDTGGGSTNFSINFGQRPFAYPLSGFKALCTTNLPSQRLLTAAR